MMSPGLSKPQRSKTDALPRAFGRIATHWRAIISVLVLAAVALLVEFSDEFLSAELIYLALLLIFVASQIFWIRRLIELVTGQLRGVPRRRVAIGVMLLYVFVLAYSFPTTVGQGHTFRLGFYTRSRIVAEAVFWCWFVGSILAFALVMAFGAIDCATRAAGWLLRKILQPKQARISNSDVADSPEPGRRRFLENTAVLLAALPFAATGYGLLYGRLNVEITRPRIRLQRLPMAFNGFQIAQLSDIHISPFTTADHIRDCVSITNGLKPDLIVLTGDYIGWDPERQAEVVRTLAGLRAPFGVFGCLGNHEEESGTEDSITRLFAAQGIRMLRQERVPILARGETLNLIGIDEPRGRTDAEFEQDLRHRLQQIEKLAMSGAPNILLSHSPYSAYLDRAHQLGIDLILAGHTHGGQLSLDFIHRGLNLAHLIYRYDTGWYEKDGAQLYVNRGIGTTGFPIRLGARPEITFLELARV